MYLSTRHSYFYLICFCFLWFPCKVELKVTLKSCLVQHLWLHCLTFETLSCFVTVPAVWVFFPSRCLLSLRSSCGPAVLAGRSFSLISCQWAVFKVSLCGGNWLFYAFTVCWGRSLFVAEGPSTWLLPVHSLHALCCFPAQQHQSTGQWKMIRQSSETSKQTSSPRSV